MGYKKKRSADDTSHVKRKRHKKTNTARDQNLETEMSTFETAELLDSQTLREGMLLLGCVTEVKATFLKMSLPGFLSGRVPLSNISNPFTNSLREYATNAEIDAPSLSSIIKVGMIFPCKVIEISRDSSMKVKSIMLSINPTDINVDLKPSLLYPKMVLYVSVNSIEDHGCVVDVGSKCIKGFLPKEFYQDHREEFKIGEVIPVVVRQILSDKTSARIQLSLQDHKKSFPTVSVEDVNLQAILPGAKIVGDVIDIKYPFIYIKYLCYDACASVLSFGPAYTSVNIGKQVCGTVLYVHPITHMIYLSLNLKPSPEPFESEYFGLRKYAGVKNLKYFCSYKKLSYYTIKKGILGFIHTKDLPKSAVNETLSKACILRCHYMDNLLELSAKPSFLEKDIIFPDEVQVGDIYEAVVLSHMYDGMFVRICPGLSGFVRRIHMSDVFVTKPEILHPVSSKVQCRVLSTDGKGKLNLTCKESLLRLPEQYILSSYENVQKGQFYKGVIAQKTDTYILLVFFNDIKGIVLSSHVPKGSILFEGQTVLCEVRFCNPSKKQLRLSLQTGERCSIEKIDDFWDEPAEKSVNGKKILNRHKENLVHHDKIHQNGMNSKNLLKADKNTDDSLGPITGETISTGSGIITVITSIKGNQLNIMFNNKVKGRVHVTELGCTTENSYPLKEFSVGQKIEVYVIGGLIRKKSNYLPVSHQNFAAFKECSMKYPPYTIDQDYSPGKSLMAYVKEVHDVSVLLWLTPYQTGVLDYLHFSENLKSIKSLRRHLKIGLALKVSVLEDKGSTITLTKIDKILPESGRNIVGLIQIPCSERGLVLKLPFGYHGSVAVTDLTDIYTQVPMLFQKYCRFKFLLCHILEVNHETKYCQLSLRKSRIYGKTNIPSADFCPEISQDDITVGNIVKGFVKSASNSAIIVTFGRNLEGTVQIHTCSSANCRSCEISKGIIQKYPVGSIIEVTVKEHFKDGRSCVLDFSVSEILKNEKCSRLAVEEEISWDED